MADKAEKHRLAVKKYREKLGIETLRERTKGYTQKKREDLEYKQKEKDKLRSRDKSNELKVQKLNTMFEAIAIADILVNNIYEETIDELPEKRGRGRPKLTEEQKAEKKALRDANKNL